MIDRLTPRQIRTLLDLLTGAVVVSVAFALAGLTWRLAGHAGTGAITVPSAGRAPAASVDVAPALALAPFGKASVTDASQPTSLPLELKGVVAAQPASLSTAFIAVGGQPATPFHVGEAVSGATIQAILRDRVILSNGGRSEYLAFPVPGQPATAAPATGIQPATSPPAPNPAPQQAPPAPTMNPSSLLQRFDATPTAGGYRVGANAPSGLLPGDVLQSVNGTSITDSTAAVAAYNSAQANGSATITILRDGKRLTLTVPVR